MAEQTKMLLILEAQRDEQIVQSVGAEEAKDVMMRLHRDKTVVFSQSPDIALAKDPKTGKSNKDWSQLLLDQKLEGDTEYMTALGVMYSFQTKLAEINNDVLNLVERLNVTKTQCRLLSAMLEVVKDT